MALTNSTTKAMAFGNVIFGGVIGAGVDIGTGAAYDYPTLIANPIACKEGTKPATAGAIAKPADSNAAAAPK